MPVEPSCHQCGQPNPQLHPTGLTKCCGVSLKVLYVWRCSKCFSESLAGAGLSSTICCNAAPLRCKICRTPRSTRWGAGPAGRNTLCAPCTSDFGMGKGPFGSPEQFSQKMPDRNAFLSVMTEYQACKIDAGMAVQQVTKLCGSNSELLKEFNDFLPDRWCIVFRDRKILVKCPVSVDVFPKAEQNIIPVRNGVATNSKAPSKMVVNEKSRNSIPIPVHQNTPAANAPSFSGCGLGIQPAGHAKLPPLAPRPPELKASTRKTKGEPSPVAHPQFMAPSKSNVSLKVDGLAMDGYGTDVSWHCNNAAVRTPIPSPGANNSINSHGNPRNEVAENAEKGLPVLSSSTPQLKVTTRATSKRLKSRNSTSPQPMLTTNGTDTSKFVNQELRESRKRKNSFHAHVRGSSDPKRTRRETKKLQSTNEPIENANLILPVGTKRSKSILRSSPTSNISSRTNKVVDANSLSPKKPTRTSRKRAPIKVVSTNSSQAAPERKETNARVMTSEIIDLTSDNGEVPALRRRCSLRLRGARLRSFGRSSAVKAKRTLAIRSQSDNVDIKQPSPKVGSLDSKKMSTTSREDTKELQSASKTKPNAESKRNAEKSEVDPGRVTSPKSKKRATSPKRKSAVKSSLRNYSLRTHKSETVVAKEKPESSSSPRRRTRNVKPPILSGTNLTPSVKPCVDCGTPAEQGPWRANASLCFECLESKNNTQRKKSRTAQLRHSDTDRRCSKCGMRNIRHTEDGLTSCCDKEGVRSAKHQQSPDCEETVHESKPKFSSLSSQSFDGRIAPTTRELSIRSDRRQKDAEPQKQDAVVVGEEEKKPKQAGETSVSDPKSPIPSENDREELQLLTPVQVKKQDLPPEIVLDNAQLQSSFVNEHQTDGVKKKQDSTVIDLPIDIAAFVSVDFVPKKA